MSGDTKTYTTDHWHDFYAKTLNGEGFDFALNKTVDRKGVPPGMIFKYTNGANHYASLGLTGNPNLSGHRSTFMRVSLLLRNPTADVRMDEVQAFGSLTLSCNPETESQSVIIRGAFHYQVEPVELTSIEELDINQAKNIGKIIMFPRDKNMYMILGFAPELPESQCMVMRMTTNDADRDAGKQAVSSINPFISTVALGKSIAVVGKTTIHHWISNK